MKNKRIIEDKGEKIHDKICLILNEIVAKIKRFKNSNQPYNLTLEFEKFIFQEINNLIEKD